MRQSQDETRFGLSMSKRTQNTIKIKTSFVVLGISRFVSSPKRHNARDLDEDHDDGDETAERNSSTPRQKSSTSREIVIWNEALWGWRRGKSKSRICTEI